MEAEIDEGPFDGGLHRRGSRSTGAYNEGADIIEELRSTGRGWSSLCRGQQGSYQDLTRFNKFAIQAKGPDGKWTRKPLAYRESNNVHLLITRPPEICVNLVFKHIHAASSYTICRQVVPFIYLFSSVRTSAS